MDLLEARALLAALSPKHLALLRKLQAGENPLMTGFTLREFINHSFVHLQAGKAVITRRGEAFLTALDGGSSDGPSAA